MTSVTMVLNACRGAAVRVRIAVVNLCFARSSANAIQTAPRTAARLGIAALKMYVWGAKPQVTIARTTTNAERKSALWTKTFLT